MIAADILATAGSDSPSVYQNINSFPPAFSGSGAGSCGPQLMARVPRHSDTAARDGVRRDSYASDTTHLPPEIRAPPGRPLSKRAAAATAEEAAAVPPTAEEPARSPARPQSATDEEVGIVAPDAAHFGSSLRAAAYRIDEFDIQMADTLRDAQLLRLL